MLYIKLSLDNPTQFCSCEIAVGLQDSRITKSDLMALKQCPDGDEISHVSDYDKGSIISDYLYKSLIIQIICIKDVYYSGALYNFSNV